MIRALDASRWTLFRPTLIIFFHRVLTKIQFCAIFIFTAMASLMNEKIVRKPRNVLIDPVVLREARIESLRSEKKLGEWLEEAIKEKIEREKEG